MDKIARVRMRGKGMKNDFQNSEDGLVNSRINILLVYINQLYL